MNTSNTDRNKTMQRVEAEHLIAHARLINDYAKIANCSLQQAMKELQSQTCMTTTWQECALAFAKGEECPSYLIEMHRIYQLAKEIKKGGE